MVGSKAKIQESTCFSVIRILYSAKYVRSRTARAGPEIRCQRGWVEFLSQSLDGKGPGENEKLRQFQRVSLAALMCSPQLAWQKRRPLLTSFCSARWVSAKF